MCKESKRYQARHQCPACKEKTGSKRLLRCSVLLLRDEYVHSVVCPDHGGQLIPVAKTKRGLRAEGVR
jgi:hypothetical protein